MKGQQGIGTILILIAVVLAAVIAAVVLIQTADQLRTEALNLQKEHVQTLLNRVRIDKVQGVVGKCGNDLCITHLLIEVSLEAGSEPLDLRKSLFSVQTDEYFLSGVRFVPPEELYKYSDQNDPERDELNYINNIILDTNISSSPHPSCRATMSNIQEKLLSYFHDDNAFDLSHLTAIMDPFPLNPVPPEAGTIYSALWIECADDGDTHTLLPGQRIIIFYRLKGPLRSSERFSIELGSTTGYTVKKELSVPRGIGGKVIDIYP